MALTTITRDDVPAYLRDGGFFCSLSAENGDTFEVPIDACKPDLYIDSVEDLKYLLTSLRFWMVIAPPMEVVQYCLGVGIATGADLQLLDDEFGRELPYVTVFRRLCAANTDRLNVAIRSGYLEVLRFVVDDMEKRSGKLELRNDHFGVALMAGDVRILAYLNDQGCPHKPSSEFYTINLQCLQYALSDCPGYEPCFNSYCSAGVDVSLVAHLLSHGYSWDVSTLTVCAEANRLSLIQYLHERGCEEWGMVTEVAGRGGHLSVLQYAVERGAPWANDALALVAQRQHWECVKYALSQGCPCSFDVTMEIALYAVPMLQYWCESGCTVDPAVGADLLTYLELQGEEWSTKALDLVMRAEDDNLRTLGARYKGLVCVDFGGPCAAAAAALSGDSALRCLRFLHERRCPWDHEAVRTAAQAGQLTCLRYLLEHGCPIVDPSPLYHPWPRPTLCT